MILKNQYRPRSRINKSLNISFYIVYGMSGKKKSLGNRPRLGPKELKVLAFLELNGGSAWREDVFNKFSWASKYEGILARRLYRMQEKGLILISEELNPATGKRKKKIYLVK